MPSGRAWPFAGKGGRPPFTGLTAQFPSAPWGGSNNIGGASPLTANATTYLPLPTPDVGTSFISGSINIVTTLPIDADGTVLGAFFKYDVSASAYVQMSATQSLETAAFTLKNAKVVGPKTGYTEAELYFDTGDTLYFGVISDSAAIDTQPAGIIANAKCTAIANNT